MTIRSAKTGTLGSFAGNVSSVAKPTNPTINSVTAGNTGATVDVALTFPAIGATATNYTVTSSPGSLSATGNTSPITVSGLTPNTAYTFTATGTNNQGTGATSPASNSVTTNSAYILLQNYTSSTNFSVPSGVNAIAVWTVGGGAGGNAGNQGGTGYTNRGSYQYQGNGGTGGISSGVTSFQEYAVNSGQNFAITVGAGGNAGAGGGTSNFGSVAQMAGNTATYNFSSGNISTVTASGGGGGGTSSSVGGVDNTGFNNGQSLLGFGTANFFQVAGGGGGSAGLSYGGGQPAGAGISNVGGGSGGSIAPWPFQQPQAGTTGNIRGSGGGGGAGANSGNSARGNGAPGQGGTIIIYGKY